MKIKRQSATIITPAVRRAHSRKIWEVRYRYAVEETKDGFCRIYCEFRKQAEETVKRLKAEHERACDEYAAAIADGVNHCDMPVYPGPEPNPEITALEFAGTVRQMLIQALEHNA